MKIRSFSAVSLLSFLASLPAFAAAPHDHATADSMEGSFLRLKSGINYLETNAEVSHLNPIAVDAIYRLSPEFGLGLNLMYASGNHSIATAAGSSNLNLFNLNKKQTQVLVSGSYFFNLGHARASLGAKAGISFNSDTSSLSSGLSGALGYEVTKNKFTFGPTFDLDLPLYGTWFINVGTDLMVSESFYNFHSLYVGLGVAL